MSVVIVMAHERNGWQITNNGEMTVTTPFDGYRQSKWSWSHENSAETWKCHHELDVTSRQFVVDVDASNRLTRAERKLSAKFAFSAPADLASNINAAVDYQHDLRAWKSNGRTNFQWGRRAFGHEHAIDIQPYTALVTTVKFATPYRGYEQLGVALNLRRTGNAWRANNEVLMGPVGKATLDGSLNYNGYNFDSMIRVTTPVRGLERIVVNARNAEQPGNEWASHADVQYAPGKTMSFDSKLSLGSRRTIELEAATPFSFLRQMKFKSGCSGVWRSFQAFGELQHNLLGPEKITAMMSADTNNLQRMNGQLMIRAPFDQFSTLRLTARHTQDTYEHKTTTVSWQFNRYQGSLLHDVTATSWVDFDSRYELEYLSNRKIELTSSFHLDPKIVATATLRSPCEHARLVSFSFNQEGPLDNFKVQSSLQLNNQKITKSLEFQLRRNTLTVSGNIETPFARLRTLTYTVNHNGDWRNFRNNLVVTYNGQEMTGSSEFVAAPYSAKLELRTPWRPLRSFNYQQANKPGNTFRGWTNSWSLESNGQRQSASSDVDWDGNQLEVDWRYWSNGQQEYSIRVSHTGTSLSHLSNNVVIQLDDKQITGAMELRRTRGNIDLQLNAASNYRGYERMEVVFKHELSNGGFKTTASISTPFRAFPRASTELTYQRTANQLRSEFSAQMPFDAVRRLAVSLNHQGTPAEFSSSLTATVNDKTGTARLTFKNVPRLMESSLSVQTPFDGYERFQTSFAFNGEPRDFTATANARLPFAGYERFDAELTHRGDWRTFQTSGKVESSNANLRRVTFNVEHSASSWRQVRTLASVAVPSGTFSAKFIHNGDLSNFRTNMEVKTPLNGYRTFVVGIEHEHTDSFKTSITARTSVPGYENFAVSFLKSGDVRNLQLKAEMTTSVRRLERMAINWSHNVARRGVVELHGLLETPFSPVQRQALTFSHSQARRAITTNALVETSVPGYTKFAFSSEYSSTRSNWKWDSSIETSVRGYERCSAGLEHTQQDGSNAFRTVAQLTTPFDGYNNFGAVLSHAGQPSQFRTQLRVNLPFRRVPQIDVTLTHRGASLRDFSTSLSVDYAGKKTELEAAYKAGLVRHAELNYEASFRLVAPCPYVRDFSVTLSHNLKPEMKTGAFKVVFNGDEKVCTVTLYRCYVLANRCHVFIFLCRYMSNSFYFSVVIICRIAIA